MCIIDRVWNSLILKRKKVQYDSSLHIVGRLYVHGRAGGIKIGRDVTIYSKAAVNPTSGFSHTYLRAEGNGTIVIGNHVGMSHTNITAVESVIIEDDVLLGSGVKIWDTDFHSLDFYDRMQGDCNIKTAPIKIGRGAFVGACSIILKGVTIGEKAVVGAGSVVTKDIPANEIWAGNPVRFIRKLENQENSREEKAGSLRI